VAVAVRKRKKSKQKRRKAQGLTKVSKKDSEQLTSLYDISKVLTSTLDLKKILSIITERVAKVMKADVCTLRLVMSKHTLVLRAASGLNPKASYLKKDVRIGEGVIGSVAAKRESVVVNDLWEDKRYSSKPFAYRQELRSLVSVPLLQVDKAIGVLSVYSTKKHFYTELDKKILAVFGSQAAIAIDNARLFEKTRSNYLNTMRFFASIIDAKESYTTNHSNRVMKHVLHLAEQLGLTARQKDILRYASLLHDIGKISIDASILAKPGPLTDEEWKQIVKHPVIGSKIIKKIGFLDDLIPVILYHHERYGGGGYPVGAMKGEQIPMEARILAIADAYEAMTSDRPYRKALSEKDAIAELKKCSGTQFDPKLVDMFLSVLKKSQ
jgi:putative nucleotidyltransferase with HDIG domain